MMIFLLLSVINPELKDKLINMGLDDVVNIVIQLPSADYNYAWKLKSEGRDPFAYLKEYCGTTQAPFVEFLIKNGILKENILQLWISNKIGVKGVPKRLVLKLEKELGKNTVDIREDKVIIKPMIVNQPEPLDNFYPGEDYVSGSIENIGAPYAWSRGYKGNGIVIAHMDTGCDILHHPVLRHRWRKQSGWYYAANTSITTPIDTFGHGTGTAGLALGEHGIGVAPGATLISMGIMDATEAQMSAAYQRLISYDTLRPHMTTNSWGFISHTYTGFWDEIQSQLLANIIPVFAVGNDGDSGASSADPPGNYPMVIGVGATYWQDEWVTEYSGRGPTVSTSSPWNLNAWWPRSDWNYHKPDIIAPAEPTITTAPGGGWQSFNGTSASTPHVAGALALILQANSFGEYQDTARIRKIYWYLTEFNYKQGKIDTWPNDSFGWGRIDVEKVLNNLPEPKVPFIFISSVRVKDHNNMTLSSGETDTLYITLRNTGATAESVAATIVYRDPSGITLTDGSAYYGTINKNQEVENPSSDRFQVRMPALGDTVWTYWTLRITYKYTRNGATYRDTVWDCFHLVSDFATSAAYKDTLKWDDGTPAYYYSSAYAAAQFETPSSDTILIVKYELYSSASAVCTLMVWADNNGLPLDPPVYKQAFTPTQFYPNWQSVTLSSTVVRSGKYWVGIYTPQNAAPYPLSDGSVSGLMAYKNAGGSWSVNSSGDFMIRPYVGRTAVTTPYIRPTTYNINDREYGNDDGWIDPSERVGVYISLKNIGLSAVQCTLWLKRADSYTITRVTPVDTISYIPEINNGVDVANNYNDPWVIQFWDIDSLMGRTLNFKVILKGRYKNTAGSMVTYQDSFNIKPDEPWQPLSGDTFYYDSYIDDGYFYTLNTYVSGCYYANLIKFGNTYLDSIYIANNTGDSNYIYLNNDRNAAVNADIRMYKYNPSTGLPGDTIGTRTVSVPASSNGFYKYIATASKRYTTGWIFFGTNSTLTAGNGTKPPVHIQPSILSDGVYRNTTTGDRINWTGAEVFSGISLMGSIMIRHDHPTLSYYKPSTWTWPGVLTNTSGSQTIPTTINGCWPGQTIYSHMAYIDRSTQNINTTSPRTARGTWDNYFFLDNYSKWSGTATNLNSFTALTYTNQTIYIPGGRHTVLIWGDYNDEVMGNLFNISYRYWGKQYSLTPPNFPVDSSIKEPWVPPMTGPFAGEYPNVTAYKLKFPGATRKYYCLGVRPYNMNIASDTIDIDIRVFSDFPTTAYNGYTQVIGASALGPGKVDFVVFNDAAYDSLPVGIYNFLDARDSAFVDFRQANKTVNQWSSSRVAAAVDSFKTMKDVVKVYNFVVPTTTTYACSVKSLAGADVGIALFLEGDLMSRSKALIEDDNGGAGVMEGFITPTLTAGDTVAIVVWKNNNYEAKAPVVESLFVRRQSDGYYGGIPLSTHLIELSYFSTYEGVNIMFNTNDIDYVEIYRSSEFSPFELIAKTKESPYVDKDVKSGKTYDYKVKFVFKDGYSEEKSFSITYYGIAKLDFTYRHKDNRIILYIPKNGEYTLSIYDITGRLVERPVSGELKYGIISVPVELKNGIYFVIAEGNKEKVIKKIPIIK